MGEMVTYRSSGGTSEGYLAVPAGGETRPAVIVIEERWGVVPHIRSVADRFAQAGFVALAPDLRISTAEPEQAGKLITGPAMDQAARDIAGAAEYLVGRPEVTGKVGVVGFCAGGSLALWSATLSERIVGAVGFYPALPWEGMRPDWADYAGKGALIHCSEADGTSSAESVQTARRAIEAAGGDVTLYDYPGTAHAFFNDDRPDVFDHPAAASAWARTLEFFRAKLG